MPHDQTTDDAFLRVCEVLGIQASRYSYLDAAAIRADRDRLHAALTGLLKICADADQEEAIFPQQMELTAAQHAAWVKSMISVCPEHDRRALGVALIEASLSAERRKWIDVLVDQGGPVERWMRHTGVLTYADLDAWAQRKLREVLIMRSGREGEGPPGTDELSDHLVGKQSVLSELTANLRQIAEREAEVAHFAARGDGRGYHCDEPDVEFYHEDGTLTKAQWDFLLREKQT